jgi:uncharacterized protein
MNPIQLTLNDQQRGVFAIDENGERLAEMGIGINGKNLIVYHTQVSDKLQGQGIAGKLLSKMTAYARKNDLKVVPLCPYVLAQFKRHPEEYTDIWNKHWHQ